ncbi:MAG: hypothetical protein KGQ87_06775 [Verrucomicrobia bacterium]|nr:hypothetical protein [Verrucomicrobiota bacterium]
MQINPFDTSSKTGHMHRNGASNQPDVTSLRYNQFQKRRNRQKAKHQAEREKLNQVLTRRLLWISFILLIIGFISIMFIFKWQYADDDISATPSKLQPAITLSNSKPIIWDGPQPSEVADRFLTARTHEERLRWIRRPEQVGPIMKKFFAEGAGKDEKVINSKIIASSDDGNFITDRFELTMNDGLPRMLCIVHCDGRALVDFESYARCGSATWDEILSGKVNKAERMRVFISNNYYYNFSFTDETKWISFLAKTPESPNSIHLYGSSDNQAFLDLKKSIGTGTMTCTISIEATSEGTPHRQFILSELTAKDWVTP